MHRFGEIENPFAGGIYTKRDAAVTNAIQNEANNAFSSAEAQKQRDYEERLSSTVYQRGVNDMLAAGVNPALALGGVSTGTPSGSAAVATPYAGASGNGLESVAPLMDAAVKIAFAGQQYKMNQVAMRKTAAEAENTEIENLYKGREKRLGISFTESQISEIESRIKLNGASTDEKRANMELLAQKLETEKAVTLLTEANIEKSKAETFVDKLKAKLEEKDLEWYDEMHSTLVNYQKAETELAKARTKESLDQLRVNQAQIIHWMHENNLIDEQAYTEVSKRLNLDSEASINEWISALREKDYNWYTGDKIAEYAGDLVNAFVSVLGSLKGMPVMPYSSQSSSTVDTYNTSVSDVTTHRGK